MRGLKWATETAGRVAARQGHDLGRWRKIHGGVFESACIDCGRAMVIHVTREGNAPPVVAFGRMRGCKRPS
jgi:hypothetical protein